MIYFVYAVFYVQCRRLHARQREGHYCLHCKHYSLLNCANIWQKVQVTCYDYYFMIGIIQGLSGPDYLPVTLGLWHFEWHDKDSWQDKCVYKEENPSPFHSESWIQELLCSRYRTDSRWPMLLLLWKDASNVWWKSRTTIQPSAAMNVTFSFWMDLSNMIPVLCYNPELSVKCLHNSVRSNVCNYESCKQYPISIPQCIGFPSTPLC